MRRSGKGWHALATVLALAAVTGVAQAWAQGPWTAPAGARNTKNPVTGVGSALRTVQAQCATCHGTGGRGDGPAASTLPVKPADWSSEGVQRQTDGELFWKISSGRGVMPPWRHLPEKDRWEVVNFIRSLGK